MDKKEFEEVCKIAYQKLISIENDVKEIKEFLRKTKSKKNPEKKDDNPITDNSNSILDNFL